jgi:leucyl-tRNA synthetase
VKRALHTAIKGIGQDIDGFRFNTMISKLMILRNELKRGQAQAGSEVWTEAIHTLLLLAAPVFPHLTEELWTEVLGLGYSVHQQHWPAYDEAVLVRSELTVVVQVNGRVRDQVTVEADAARDQAHMQQLVLELPRIKQHIGEATVRKVIVVPGKLVNIVAN